MCRDAEALHFHVVRLATQESAEPETCIKTINISVVDNGVYSVQIEVPPAAVVRQAV